MLYLVILGFALSIVQFINMSFLNKGVLTVSLIISGGVLLYAIMLGRKELIEPFNLGSLILTVFSVILLCYNETLKVNPIAPTILVVSIYAPILRYMKDNPDKKAMKYNEGVPS